MYLVRVKAWMKCHMVDRGHIGVLLCQAYNVPRLRWPLFFPEVAVGKHLFHNSRRGKSNCFSNQFKKNNYYLMLVQVAESYILWIKFFEQ